MDTTRKTSQADSLDRVIELISSNLKGILKTVPIAIGFSLFLIYFCQHHFFPSFDLFSLGSLLISAAILGLLVFLLISIGISLPGWFWVDIFLKDKEVNEDFLYHFKEEDIKDKAQLEIVRQYFFWPALFYSALNIILITTDNTEAIYIFGSLVLVCLTLAGTLWRRYKLSASSLIKFTIASSLTYVFASFISLGFCILGLKEHFEGASDIEELLAAIVITSALISTFTVCAISFNNLKHSHTIFFSMLFAFFLSFANNIWFTIPGKIVNLLGIGNYIASEIHVNGKPCEISSIKWKSNNNGTCTLKNTKIIWSLGDLYRIREGTTDISIPSQNITTIIKENTKPKDIKDTPKDQA